MTSLVIQLLYIVFLILAIFIVYFIHSILKVKKKYENIPGPESSGLSGFMFGNVLELKSHLAKGLPLIDYFNKRIQNYGYTVKIRLFNNVALFSIDPEITKEVLIDMNLQKDFTIYRLLGFPTGERLAGFGLVTDTNNERWKSKRALFNPGFHRQALNNFLNEFNSKGDILMEYFRKVSDSKTEISLLNAFNRTTLDVIASVAFSMNIDSINDPSNKFNQYIYESLTSFKYLFSDPFFKYKPQNWLYIWNLRKAVKYLRELGYKQIMNRIEALNNNEILPNDILTKILQTNTDESLDIELMVDNFVTFFIAGQETTAGTLAFLFLELGRHPRILENLRNEIDNVIGKKTYITMEDLSNLEYTSCVLKEALRLYPPAVAVSRITHQDGTIGNLFVPANTVIHLSSYACGRCEKFFPDPLQYKPERFFKDSNGVYLNQIQNYTYFPFSLGPRNCIGQNFAQIEAKILIAKFLQNYEYKLSPGQCFDAAQELTLRPKDGVNCTISLRN